MPAGNAQPQKDLRTLEERWRAKLRESRDRYYDLAGQCSQLCEEVKDGMVPYPDGSFALARARRATSTALSEYRRVAEIYAKLVVSGNIPEPDDNELP